jgi:hypothetical protein
MSAPRVPVPTGYLWQPFSSDLPPPAAAEHLYDLVGCYSEAWLMCSYQPDEILQMWLAGELATAPAHRLGGWFESQMGEYYGQDYERLLRHAVLAAKVWLEFSQELQCMVGTPLRYLRERHPAFDAQMRLAEAGQ